MCKTNQEFSFVHVQSEIRIRHPSGYKVNSGDLRVWNSGGKTALQAYSVVIKIERVLKGDYISLRRGKKDIEKTRSTS